MRVLVLGILCTLLAATMAGCFGYDQDGVRSGQQVVIQYEVRDADGALLVASTTQPFVLGSGGSGLGASFEQSLQGQAVNESFERTVQPQEGGTLHRVDSMLESVPADRTFQISVVSQETGVPEEELEVGYTFPEAGLRGSDLVLVERDGTNVTFRYVFRDDEAGRQVDPFEAFGVVVHTWVEDGMVQSQLRPIEGSIVTLPVYDPLGRPSNPFGVPAGIYRIEGLEGDQLVLRGGSIAEVATQELTVNGRVLQSGPATPTPEDREHFGSRVSPVRLG